ncbi:hypothetical protein [Chryseobacterium caseinilyticum]|uniref:Lipoprotein n=1 Tax=Chryseobacterium caseinilyticum TaxID=2771428 RepID=A0ABR8ZCM5_9FLAO|nr:hypothetical protein [Chryseobacterium caseinilyticum]MBD8082603.1 hypothetical protein [Chryseobacterium caseinilyticum]
MNNSSAWKTVLTVALCLISIIRIAITCNKSSQSSYSDSSYNDVSALMSRNYERQTKAADDTASNNLFYESYDSISQLSDFEKENYSVIKLKKDSMILLDVSSKIKVESGAYFQKNYDDTLSLAIKKPDNISIFMHSYDTADDLMTNFKSVKRKLNVQDLKIKLDDKDSKFVSYSFENRGKKTNGYALLTSDKGHFTALEIESNRLSKDDLEIKAFSLITELTQ